MIIFFFFNDTATTEIYTLSLHDALPICICAIFFGQQAQPFTERKNGQRMPVFEVDLGDNMFRDRKSTRLNSSHLVISYAVFCLKKKKISTVEIDLRK